MGFKIKKSFFVNKTIKRQDKTAFSFAEMMVAMLIISLITAISVPIITKKATRTVTSTGTDMWQYTDGTKTDIYYDGGTAAIGTSTPTSSTQLLLNTPSAAQNQITFQQSGNTLGGLIMDGNDNVGLGGVHILSGIQNVAVGTGTVTVKGDNNVAIGHNANTGDSGTTVNNAVAIGALSQVTADGGTAVGYDTSAASNAVAFGFQVKATATNAIAMGYMAEATGVNSIALGYKAHASGTRAIAIGAQTVASATDSVAIGGSYVGTTYTPATTNVQGQIKIGADNGSNSVLIPGYLNVGTTTGGGGANFVVSSTIWTTSDKRLKNINGRFSGGLDEIKQISVLEYSFKKDKNKKSQVGVMAQDLQKIFPKAVTTYDKQLMIRKDEMFYAMINSIKQLDEIIKGIGAKITNTSEKLVALIKSSHENNQKLKNLEAKNKELKLRLAKLEKEIGK